MSKTVRSIVIVVALAAMAFAGYQLGNIVYDYATANRDNGAMIALAGGIDDDGGNALINYLSTLFDRASSDGQTQEMLERARARVIDFDALRAKNNDIIGWIYIPGVGVDYAITQTANNTFYLKHNAMRRRSSSGSIFLDVNASASFEDADSLVYGHHMRDGSMFGSLPRLRNDAFRENHQYIFIYTPAATKVYQISSQFITNEGEIIPSVGDTPVLTLVTCEYTSRNAHYVVRANLLETTAPGGNR